MHVLEDFLVMGPLYPMGHSTMVADRANGKNQANFSEATGEPNSEGQIPGAYEHTKFVLFNRKLSRIFHQFSRGGKLPH